MPTYSDTATTDATTLVLCESADGWSLHAPGSTDDEIGCGDAPALASGPWPEGDREGVPTDADYETVLRELLGADGDHLTSE
jgi:hypothetical protein